MSSSSKFLTHTARQLDKAINRSMRNNRRAAVKYQTQQRRAAIQQYRLQQKQQAIANAAEAVQKQEEYLHSLVSIHHHATDATDWEAVLSEPEPTAPVPTSDAEDSAIRLRDAYMPSFFDR